MSSELRSLAFALVLAIFSGCVTQTKIGQETISACNKSQIEQAMQGLYGQSVSKIKQISQLIDHTAFNEICSGNFEARTPLGGLNTKNKYPEISFPWLITYSISQEKGICITRKTELKSTGVYKNCFK